MNWPEAPKEALYTGNSMRGMFLPGETVLLAEVSFETLRKGDVVAVFDRTPSYVHRIVEKNSDYAVRKTPDIPAYAISVNVRVRNTILPSGFPLL